MQTGSDPCIAVSASADGSRVIATFANDPTVNIYSVKLLDNRLPEEIDVEPLPVSGDRPHAPRFDTAGKSMFYLSASKTVDGLSRWQDGKGSTVVNGTDEALFEPPAVSKDGNRVVIVVREEGQRHLEIVSADGKTPRRWFAKSITVQGFAGQSAADWGPQDEWIVAGGSDGKVKGLFLIALDDDSPGEPILKGLATSPVVSPKGDLIVYSGPLVKGQTQLGFVRPNRETVDLPRLWVRPGGYRFLPDGSGLVFLKIQGGINFWLLDFATQKTRPLTNLRENGRILSFDITLDKKIIFDRTRENSYIARIDHI